MEGFKNTRKMTIEELRQYQDEIRVYKKAYIKEYGSISTKIALRNYVARKRKNKESI